MRSETLGRPRRTRLLAASVVALLLLSTTGCGDDDDSPEAAFCEAGEQLRADVAELGDIDLVASGTDALREQFDAIRSDVDELRTSGGDVASEEIDSLDAAVEDLRDVLDDLNSNPDASITGAVLSAISTVGDSARAVQESLRSACE